MNFVKRAFLYCFRQKVKTLILFLVLAIISTFLLTGLAIRDASEDATADVQTAIGGKCMNYIMEQAYEIAKKEHEKKTSGKQPATGRNQNVALGISELQVYQWAEDYYL